MKDSRDDGSRSSDGSPFQRTAPDLVKVVQFEPVVHALTRLIPRK